MQEFKISDEICILCFICVNLECKYVVVCLLYVSSALVGNRFFSRFVLHKRHFEKTDVQLPLLQISNDAARSEEHTSDLQSLMRISYAVFLFKKTNTYQNSLLIV